MTGLNDLIFVDTNIFVYSADSTSKFQNQAKKIVEKFVNRELMGVISLQILLEFYSLITNKKRFKNFYSQIEATDFVRNLISVGNFKLIYPNVDSVSTVVNILESKMVVDREIFDAAIIATMITNNVTTIYTANDKDFKALSSEIEVVNPFA
ncbi:MAG: type II toxin-antitoxin system VapC family toxin [bacterium]|nr:type II toxin-antitoxin system VapC family toxin [bacterium]